MFFRCEKRAGQGFHVMSCGIEQGLECHYVSLQQRLNHLKMQRK